MDDAAVVVQKVSMEMLIISSHCEMEYLVKHMNSS